jgi:DegV family protein with EDD domain
MSVKIVTDSTSDLPKEVAQELGISVVPLNVHFNLDTFKDGVDMQADQFYHRLMTSPVLPKTSAPSPGLFKEYFNRLAQESHEIVSIHISSKLSGTYEAALAAKQEMADTCRIEVIDSKAVTMGLGLLAIVAAKAAKAGASMKEIVALVQDSIDKVFIAGAPDTLEFLQKGGRVGKAQAWLGSILSIKPIISMAEGEVVPLERVRTQAKVMERMRQLLEEHLPAREIAVLYSTDAEEAQKIFANLKKDSPRRSVYLAQFGPVLGTHLGPNSLGLITLK